MTGKSVDRPMIRGSRIAPRWLSTSVLLTLSMIAVLLGTATSAGAQSGWSCSGVPVTIVGTPGNDTLRGTSGPDVIFGREGNDTIYGLGGDDIVCGGKGNDIIYGGAGFDILFGAQGADTIYSANGTSASQRQDVRGARMFGGAGDDVIYGSARWDRMQGGLGNDRLFGYEGRDWIRAGANTDTVDGGPGIDDLHGGNGRDTIALTDGDTVRGGAGLDLCTMDSGSPNSIISCGLNVREVNAIAADQVIGNGTPASCTSAAVVAAVAAGGVIAFDCGPNPITIEMDETARVVNNAGPEIVIDGGGLVTLDGQNQNRILYMNTCDPAQIWTTSHCNDQDHPRLTVQNITFTRGNASGQHDDGGGGGAIFARGGQLAVTNVSFEDNRCATTGPDVGGAALRVFDQYQDRAVVVRDSTFRGGVCSNGGAISSIGVSWIIIDSLMTNNRAVGNGANPAQAGTPGGGSGGAIYLDGNLFTLTLRNTRITNNDANEGGGAIFFVSNNRTGTMSIENSTLTNNPSDGFETAGLPGIFYLGNGNPSIVNSTLQ